MARKIEVTMIDDIDGTSPASTVEFSFEGTSYEVDLSEANKAKLAQALEPYLEAGRKVQGSRRRGRKSSTPGGVDPAAVRRWAEANGKEVSPRGRVPREIIAAYLAAN